MSNDIAIKVENLSKCYHIYDQPRDRLKQMILPRLQRAVGVSSKQYFREFWALKDVSFEVKKGETVGIIGRNGSGKSTLLQMICGTLNPTSGSIQTNGRIAALLELGSGFNPEFTGRENVYLNGAVLGLGKDEIDCRFDEIAAFADIGDFIEQPVKTYSSGMFVRLAFAIQANVEPEILIVDEALAVGDAYFVHRCMLRINELKRKGTTVLFVSHDATAVRSLCSRAIWLVDGEVRGEGDSSRTVDAYLAHLFNHQVVAPLENNSAAPPFHSVVNKNEGIEETIPNIDRRFGDQRCQIIGVGLYDELMNPITSSKNDAVIVLRITICNHSLDDDNEMTVGYAIRNSKGLDIASTNSKIECVKIFPPAIGGYLTIKIKITLPCLHPGSYSFTVSSGYVNHDAEIVVADRIHNALAFDLMSEKQVHVLMNFPTEIELDW
ncbi:ABC transporter ATP-binding protein [Comamonas aquatica]|uniref:ABC transporter ATP-binding protein n=1 Tax=Comamonas aquatica TaxID=225991 RepID=UPI0021B0C5F0|nr:ABC transporter ATP-binding protein [Comamonas aquatica]